MVVLQKKRFQKKFYDDKKSLTSFHVLLAGLSEPGKPEVPWPHHILADELRISQPWLQWGRLATRFFRPSDGPDLAIA